MNEPVESPLSARAPEVVIEGPASAAVSTATLAGDDNEVANPAVSGARKSLPGPGIFAAIGWAILFILGQAILVAIAAAILAGIHWLIGTPARAINDVIQPWLLPLSVAVNLVLAVGIVRWRLGKDAARKIGWRWPDAVDLFPVLLMIAPLIAISSAVGELVQFALGNPKIPQHEMIGGMIGQGWGSLVFWGCVLPAVGEEIFFRGFLGRGLVARYGIWVGVSITSFLFGLFHVAPSQIAATFLLGIALHAIFLATKSLPAAMVAHFSVNLLGFSLRRLMADQQEPSEVSAIAMLVLAIASVALLGIWMYRLRRRWVAPDGTVLQPPYLTAEVPALPAVAIRDRLSDHATLVGIALAVWLGFLATVLVALRP